MRTVDPSARVYRVRAVIDGRPGMETVAPRETPVGVEAVVAAIDLPVGIDRGGIGDALIRPGKGPVGGKAAEIPTIHITQGDVHLPVRPYRGRGVVV